VKISSLPAIPQKERTRFTAPGKCAKLRSAPISPSPGPTLESAAIAAEMEGSRRYPPADTVAAVTAAIRRYAANDL
jgi:hypothetical protein